MFTCYTIGSVCFYTTSPPHPKQTKKIIMKMFMNMFTILQDLEGAKVREKRKGWTVYKHENTKTRTCVCGGVGQFVEKP